MTRAATMIDEYAASSDDAPRGPAVRWNGDGTYTPTCLACGYSGRDQPSHSDALSAARAHARTQRHQEGER